MDNEHKMQGRKRIKNSATLTVGDRPYTPFGPSVVEK